MSEHIRLDPVPAAIAAIAAGRPVVVVDDADRENLFRLDVAIQRVNLDKGPKDAAVIELTGVYHNLLRRWSEV